VEFARIGKMTVRMVTGEHLETAKAVAIDSGILDQDFLELTESEQNEVCMTAERFKETVFGSKKNQLKTLSASFVPD